jgi:hypothetical protein
VDVDERRPEARRRLKVALQDGHRTLEEVWLVAGEVDEIGSVDRDRGDVVFREPLAEPFLLLGRFAASLPGRGVVTEDLDRGRADRVRPLDGLEHSATQRQVRAQPKPVGSHRRHGSRAAADLTTIKWSGTIR